MVLAPPELLLPPSKIIVNGLDDRTGPNDIVQIVGSEQTGYATIVGRKDHFNNHPKGEGLDVTNWKCRSCGRKVFQPNKPISCDCMKPRYIEGPTCWVLECKRSELPPMWRLEYYNDPASPGIPLSRIVPIFRMKLENFRRTRRRINRPGLHNLFEIDAAVFDEGDYDDFIAQQKFFDVFRNVLITVGTAKDHASHSNAIVAGDSADHIFTYVGGPYVENVAVGAKLLNFWCTVANQGQKITASSGVVFDVYNGATAEVNTIRNYELEATGTADQCILGIYVEAHDMKMHGGDTDVVLCHQGSLIKNSCLYDGGVRGVRFIGIGCKLIHVTVAHCAGIGVNPGAASRSVVASLSAFNGTDYDDAASGNSQCNVSSDGTADGPGDADGWIDTYFTDDAARDLSLSDTGKAWLAARFFGGPYASLDIARNVRRTTGVFFPGAYDGNPEIPGDTPPDDPVLISVTPGDGKLTISLTGESGKSYYSRVWDATGGLSAENNSFKVTGDGSTPVIINHTGLTNKKPYLVLIYGRDGTAWSDVVMDGIDYIPDTTTALTYEKIGNIIRGRVKSQIEDGQSVEVLYDNMDEAAFTKPTDAAWIRAALLPGEATQTTFGGSTNRFRKVGVLHITVYNPIEKGDKVNRELADAVVDAFRNVSASGVVFKTPSLGTAMRDGMWWRQTITCPYYADDFGG